MKMRFIVIILIALGIIGLGLISLGQYLNQSNPETMFRRVVVNPIPVNTKIKNFIYHKGGIGSWTALFQIQCNQDDLDKIISYNSMTLDDKTYLPSDSLNILNTLAREYPNSFFNNNELSQMKVYNSYFDEDKNNPDGIDRFLIINKINGEVYFYAVRY